MKLGTRQPSRQERMFRDAEKRSADLNNAFMELMKHPTNPLTKKDLDGLVARRPEKYAKFAGFRDQLPD